ncbi:TIGR03862 family flavoprotein [Belnapia moabensis]|uniref:TIGR03862 family flavoprotein n=1 Tax=Belnapia moabensis TaxID=365533 RepID=UPI0005B97066|nr:TIGR03862 family flavoprotein [Belnapia moabensis]
MNPNEVAVIGAGPAGLVAAETLAAAGLAVTVFDRMPSPGRKLLIAGRGGLNLTHSEPLERFIGRYGAASGRLEAALRAFPPAALMDWAEGLGQPLFTGTSGRVFPQALKASPLLRAWLARLAEQGVGFRFRHRWEGWAEDGALRLASPEGEMALRPAAVLLALGGASWPRLGSDGRWVRFFPADEVAPLRPANCGFLFGWSEVFRSRFEGQPLKRIALEFGGERVRGEALVTAGGIEGGAVYALGAPLREAIAAGGEAVVRIDLRPDEAAEALAARLDGPRGGVSVSNRLRRVGLSPIGIGLVQEALHGGTREPLSRLVKGVPLRLTGTAPIERAISTAGGVGWEAVDERFMLQGRPGTFLAGEMLDWEAPTGGYLLQACFSTGVAAARGILGYLGR